MVGTFCMQRLRLAKASAVDGGASIITRRMHLRRYTSTRIHKSVTYALFAYMVHTHPTLAHRPQGAAPAGDMSTARRHGHAES
jgi:hypothetical protein